VHELPKTQSGKIVRRLLRQKYLGEELGDLSTVVNPAILTPEGVAEFEGRWGAL
jgi:acetyl-CoA synthetase